MEEARKLYFKHKEINSILLSKSVRVSRAYNREFNRMKSEENTLSSTKITRDNSAFAIIIEDNFTSADLI